MKEQIKKILQKAIGELKTQENWGEFEAPEIAVDYPKNEAFGDYTTNVAMILAKLVKKNPMELADQMAKWLNGQMAKKYEKIEAVKPGYINFYLSKEYLQNKIAEINEEKDKFGNSEVGQGIKVNNEFISANPTGPLHLGNGRGGFLGDCISNVLDKCSYLVQKEYYVNDAGEQIIKLGHSVLKDEEAEYRGDYIDKLNEKLELLKKQAKETTEKLNTGDGNKYIKSLGYIISQNIVAEIIKPTVEQRMRIKGMQYISEKVLYNICKVDEAINTLKEKNLTYEKEGATWLKTTKFGDDKDRVLIKGDGQKTYFASDCGYILNKMERGFDKIIEIWGADHHGYISRFRAAAEALGFKGELKFIIVQLVRLVKDGKEVRMSKRAGNVVYIDDLIDKVGHDVTRFFFLMYASDTHMNFDLGLAEEQSEKNPVFYVQYAHARICSILGKSEIRNSKSETNSNAKNSNAQNIRLDLLTHDKELSLIREMNKFPELVEEIAGSYEVHKLPHYAIKLADKFHSFYNDCRVIDEKNPALSMARLELVKAVKIILGETLRLVGVSAPEKM